ncbi:MAG: glycoside hydrolase family 95 protein [Clostridia bacterium]|nr:glycoside hydrolase family 95 protein [Clostridia bacterium]
MRNKTLLLKNEADEWENTTPIGCGNLAASIYGNVGIERLQLNEEYIWSGEEQAPPENFYDAYNKIRTLLKAGKAVAAGEWANENTQGIFCSVGSYETAGELFLDIHGEGDRVFEDYRRELDMEMGIATVSYTKNGVKYTREYFASYPDNAIVGRIFADEKGLVSFAADYQREARAFDGQVCSEQKSIEKRFEDGIYTIWGETLSGGHKFVVKIGFYPEGGTWRFTDGKMIVERADACVFYITIQTLGSESKRLPLAISELAKKGYAAIKKAAIEDYAALMGRSDIEICGDEKESELSASERLELIKKGERDNGFFALFYQFGKHLLISSSRPGTLPANLQGKWNDCVQAIWNSDYHTNINLQMNYWHAETANLGECTMPLFAYMTEKLLPGGRRTAEICYHCRGMVVHHLSDIYGMASAADGVWGLWPLGGGWLAFHLWEHYLFTKDEKFLREVAYPYIAACARFYLDYMFEDERGRLLSGPSASPENGYIVDGKVVYMCLSPTMDIQIIGGLLGFYIEMEEILKIDEQMKGEAEAALGKMPPLRVGKGGRLLEWLEDYEEYEPGHRHISHAFGLYPGWSIGWDKPVLFDAIKKTIERRLSYGGGQTSWSASWLINLYARLFDGENAKEMLLKLFCNSVKPNLFSVHPPFQIDGNFGGAAGILEMLIQSRNQMIHLIPALPKSWKNGSFRGLRARGGFELNATWKNGKVVLFTIKAVEGYGEVVVKVNGKEYALDLGRGEERTLVL